MLKKDQKTEDIKKKIVKEVNDKVKKEIFPENIISRGTEFIYTGIPVGHAVNSIVDGNTVMQMPNAQVVGNSNVPMVYLNGETVPYGYASPGNDIKVLEIFEGMLLVLVPVGNGPTGDGQWTIGYFDTSVLGNTVEINYNTITWNDASNKTVVDGNGNFMYSLPADQIIQFLYETPNGNYACILFNGADGELLTGYVPMSDGTFYRYDYLRTGSLQAPGIANNSTPQSGSGSTSQPSSGSTSQPSSGSTSQSTNLMPCATQNGNIITVGDLTLNLNELTYIDCSSNYVYSNGYSQKYVDFVKAAEGLNLSAYLDITGHWTIGYGHEFTPGVEKNGYTFYEDSTISLSEANAVLIADLNATSQAMVAQLSSSFPSFSFTTTSQFDAILDMAFNLGVYEGELGSGLQHSIFADCLASNYSNLQLAFVEWCHGKVDGVEEAVFGLYRRRLEEFIMFTTGLYVSLPSGNIGQIESLLDFTCPYTFN